jgi:hypothetical protein
MSTANADEPAAKGMSTLVADDGAVPPSRASLEQRNEKEIIENPNEITQNAQLGVQKAEAVALVWSKPAVYAIYAW